jgi:hypothetical protein
MTPSKRPPKTPRVTTGRFGTLAAFLPINATRTPFFRGRNSLIIIPALAFALALGLASTALAETVEKPTASTPAPLFAAHATLHGTLDPGKTGGPFEMDTYEFVYLQSATACKGTGEVKTAEGLSLGEGKEAVSQALEGLTPNTSYSVCLVAHNEAKTEESVSAKLTFKTAVAVKPEAPSTEPPTEVKGDTAIFAGIVNPNITAEVEPGAYEFLYKATATATQAECESVGASKAPASPAVYAGAGPEPFSEAVAGLTQDTEYVVCLAATNAGGRTVGPAVAFKTGTPETPATSPVQPLSGTTATLNGVLNPDHAGEAGTYEFLYAPAAEGCEGEHHRTTPQGTSTGVTPEPVSASLSKLLPGTEYTFCLRATNGSGETATSFPVTFTTTAVGLEDSPTVTQSEAEVSAEIGTDNAPTTYEVQYGTNNVAESSIPTPEATIEPSSAPVEVQQRLANLQPGKEYRFRFVANNGPGSVDGEERTFTTPSPAEAEASATEAACKAEHPAQPPRVPLSAVLPDCRAYELVSPVDTGGTDAADLIFSGRARAAVSGEAVTYVAAGTFGGATGATLADQYLSRREPGQDRWSTEAITPLQAPEAALEYQAYENAVFTPELEAGIAGTKAKLTETAPDLNGNFGLYRVSFGDPAAYQYVGSSGNTKLTFASGASTDLSHVVFGEDGGVQDEEIGTKAVSEWVNGSVMPVGVVNDGESISASVGGAIPQTQGGSYGYFKDAWRAVSANGSRVYFTSPAGEKNRFGLEPPGQLYLREHAEQLQSKLEHPEANATGTLNVGSASVSVEAIPGSASYASFVEGSTGVTLNPAGATGVFYAGQPVSGPGIPPAATVVKVSGTALTLSAPATASGTEVVITSTRADAFAVGQQINGYGLSPGTTVMAVVAPVVPGAPGTLTLSAPADVSASGVALQAGGECTEPEKACTVDVSAPQRSTSDTHGLQEPRYWGASVEGEKVFFTSKAELTEDADTGPMDNAANLYEYDSERPAAERLKDLTVDGEGDGAAVQGVVQISGDGSYVYFVANGVLTSKANANNETAKPGTCTSRASTGECNLYVSHEGGEPVFIATLAGADETDWNLVSSSYQDAGPAINTAVVSPSGGALAFISDRRLTGYDNEQAAPGECEDHNNQGEVVFTETGACREVFLYDAPTARTSCASCNPTGARPKGPASFGEPAKAVSSYRPRNLSEGGALFFDSSDALVPRAGDGQKNVYEYEDGQVHAISDVAGGFESFFIDASANGENVFFGSEDKLVSQDPGGNVAVYDARVGGGFSEPLSPPPCNNGDACKPPPAAQPSIYGAPASATFSGAGNPTPPAPLIVPPKVKTAAQLKAEKLAAALKTCRKKSNKKARTSCEASARKKYSPTKKKATKKKTKAKKSSIGTKNGRGI